MSVSSALVAAVGLAVLASGVATAAPQATVTYSFQPVADTSIYADILGENLNWDHVSDAKGESLWLSTTAGGLLRRALVRFDLGDASQAAAVAALEEHALRGPRPRDFAAIHRRLLEAVQPDRRGKAPPEWKQVRLSAATRLVDQLQAAVEAAGQALSFSFSAGLAVHAEGEPELLLLDRADRALYQAKAGGRNRVVML
jgi:hypothetical protein